MHTLLASRPNVIRARCERGFRDETRVVKIIWGREAVEGFFLLTWQVREENLRIFHPSNDCKWLLGGRSLLHGGLHL